MRCLISLVTVGTVVGIAPSALAQIPDYYVGVGVRAGFNDDTAAVIDSKIKVVDLSDVNDVSISARPALLFGNDTELRLPVSIETNFGERLFPFVGGGVAYNVDGNSNVDPMVTGGVDIGVLDNFVINLELNVLFKPSDTDTELVGSFNYAF